MATPGTIEEITTLLKRKQQEYKETEERAVQLQADIRVIQQTIGLLQTDITQPAVTDQKHLSTYTIVTQALKAHNQPIRAGALIVIIRKTRPWFSSGTVTVHLSRMCREGLVDRPARGVYVWTHKQEGNHA
jgi:hypothetical protein